MSSKSQPRGAESPVTANSKSTNSSKLAAPGDVKPSNVPKLSLDASQEPNQRNVAPMLRSYSQMLPSRLVSHPPYAALTVRPRDSKHALSSSTGPSTASSTATSSVRIFITSDLTPHRFCALVVKSGWKWDDFLEAASAKLSGGTQSPRQAHVVGSVTAANAIFASNGAEIGSLNDLRDDDQVCIRFQKRLTLSPAAAEILTSPNGDGLVQSTSRDSITTVRDDQVYYLPTNGVFRLLSPELADVSPLVLSDELVADLVQDEWKQILAETEGESFENKETKKASLRKLFQMLLSSTDPNFTETVLQTYDYLVPHHTFLALLVVHFRSPLLPMEMALGLFGSGQAPVRPTPPPSRSAAGGSSTLPTFGMSVQMTDPIKRGAAQTRIVNIVKRWIELRFSSLVQDLAVVELIDDLISYLASSPERLRSYGESIALTVKMTRRQNIMILRDLELAEQTEVSKDKIGFTRAIEVTPFELACQLTIADQDIFYRLTLGELQAMQFDSPDRAQLSPHVVQWIAHSGFITSWVVASILGPPGEPNPGPKKRAAIIGHFISTINELKTMKSYNAMMQIYHALIHPAIERLNATWEAVMPKHMAIKEYIAEMMKPPSSVGYHNLIQTVDAPAIPYIEHHLNELRHIEEAETVLENGDINVGKLERLAKAVRTVMRLQKTTYNLVPHSGFMSFICTYDVPPVSTLVELSLVLEPDANSSTNGGAAAKIVVRPIARSTSELRSPAHDSSSSNAGSNAASTTAASLVSKFRSGSIKAERKRKDSTLKKLDKEKDKEEEKRKKKWEKQAKKIKPLLTAALSFDQAILNSDIYEQFQSYSNDTAFLNALAFYKSVVEFKKMFGSDVEPAARRTREEAARIAMNHLNGGTAQGPEFTSSLDARIKEIDLKARSETGIFTNNIFDPLLTDLNSMLSTAFVLFKAQRNPS